MGDAKYCCTEMAMAHNQRQVVWGNDEDGSWNVATGAFGNYALTDVRYCPFCGVAMPLGNDWEEK
jgi:hypothetical protein